MWIYYAINKLLSTLLDILISFKGLSYEDEIIKGKLKEENR